ncbi:hypothetical protein H6G89_16085 [Oscillatoria sp. FACHB-1407]|nr:hypothetical protein [Oscillatoria sp. FACHB-1407]MBD2462565.1 hypothetical protein [Oscillatoria sp. FACHB-1407]
MNSRLGEPGSPTRTLEEAGFDEPTQVDLAPRAVVLTAKILILNSR